jgi:hypothetical protein
VRTLAGRTLPLICAVGLAAAASGCNACTGDWMILDGFQKRFAELKLGATRQDVVATLGEPQREEATFHLPQAEGYESEYERAKASSASRFLYWQTGVDEVAVIGLDASNQVVFKCTAGT